MTKYDDYYRQRNVKAKAIDRREQQGWMLWALAASFSLAGAIAFFSLTF